jgi:hypothetical protein
MGGCICVHAGLHGPPSRVHQELRILSPTPGLLGAECSLQIPLTSRYCVPLAICSGGRKAVDFQLLGYVPALVLAVHVAVAQPEKVHLQVSR